LERRTVDDLLVLVENDYADTGRVAPPGHLAALRHALGTVRALEVDREMLDDLVRMWKRDGVTWPGREPKNPGRPDPQRLSGATCNRYMATLRRGYTLAREKWGLLTALTFPHEAERARQVYPARRLPADRTRDAGR
jgi:hypothetical protein